MVIFLPILNFFKFRVKGEKSIVYTAPTFMCALDLFTLTLKCVESVV